MPETQRVRSKKEKAKEKKKKRESEALNTMASITSTSFILGQLVIREMLILALSLALDRLRGWKLFSLLLSNRSIRKIGSRVGQDGYKRLLLVNQLPLTFSPSLERHETFGKLGHKLCRELCRELCHKLGHE